MKESVFKDLEFIIIEVPSKEAEASYHPGFNQMLFTTDLLYIAKTNESLAKSQLN